MITITENSSVPASAASYPYTPGAALYCPFSLSNALRTVQPEELVQPFGMWLHKVLTEKFYDPTTYAWNLGDKYSLGCPFEISEKGEIIAEFERLVELHQRGIDIHLVCNSAVDCLTATMLKRAIIYYAQK
ncbi:hypothetical protein K9N68_37320 (plasmid) [Kovacikia minuta CCNUW1]|uniref:hypothetical protein n=1 Tax=Kovacikia minuta TaxID=2931930 RepID=UPI001CCBD230|nr:hypothetical protein [Kovacikia minuta]UBF29874.1 hypothetical protein K9N68_37320 [Kovacikia minuta CCNUW1]